MGAISRQSRNRKSREAESIVQVVNPLRDMQGHPVELWIANTAYRIRSNMKLFLSTLFLIVFAMGGVVALLTYRSIQSRKSVEAFETLMKNPVMSAGKIGSERAVQKLDEYMATYGDVQSTNRANLKKIELLLAEKKYGDAGAAAGLIATGVNDNYLKAYFSLRAAGYYEMDKNFAKALVYYEQADGIVKEENMIKALSLFGRGRALFAMGKKEEGRSIISKFMEMKDLSGGEELKLQAAAYLIRASHENPNAQTKLPATPAGVK